LVLGSLDATVTGGNITLNEAGNRIANLGLVSVTGGDLSVTSFTGFDVSGVTAGNVTLRSLSSVIATKLSGVASNANGTITLAAETGIGLSGPLAAGTGIVDLTVGKGGVTQDAGGPITAGTLRSTGGVSGSVQLDKAANGIATIADFAAGGTFALNNAVALKVGGTLAAADIAIVGGAASANAIDIAGTARSAAGGSIALVATSGGIALSGIVDASTIGVLDLSAAGPGVAQSGGTIVAGALRSSNGLGGSVILDQPGNAIGTLGPITVSAGSLAVTSAIPLTSVGPVSVGAGNLALTGTSAGTALSITGPVTVSGTARLAATDSAGGIALGAALQAGVLELSAGTGGVVQSGGALALGSLQSSGLSGSVTLPQPGNTIASIGTFVLNSGDATIVSSAPITVAGTLNALQGDISVTGLAAGPTSVNVAGKVASGPGKTTTLAAAIGGITITGSAAAPGGQLVLPTATGVVAPGVLAADRLAVSATKSGDVALAGPNAIGTLAGAILANGNFLLNNAAPLTISGPLTARTLGITAADTLRVSDGVSIVTDGLPRIDQGVSNTLTDPQIAKLTTTGLGSHLAVTSSFGAPAKIDVGKINVMPFSAQMATLDLVLPHPAAGTISIGQLTGKSTDLILVTRAGGIATGTIDVAGLLVVGNGGKADLFGKIGGVDGQAAANRANISPQPSSDYRFNACPITSVNCVLIPIQTVPPISPLRDVPIIRDRPTQDDTDVQLPNVSEEDY
jgi:hypothetical protein